LLILCFGFGIQGAIKHIYIYIQTSHSMNVIFLFYKTPTKEREKLLPNN